MKRDQAKNILEAIEKLREQMNEYSINQNLADNQELIHLSKELDKLLNKYRDAIDEDNS